jgi:hypothetical protein
VGREGRGCEVVVGVEEHRVARRVNHETGERHESRNRIWDPRNTRNTRK